MEWIENDKEIKLTSESMTRFLFTLDDAVEAVLGALKNAKGGEVFVPQIDSYTLPTCVKALELLTNKKGKTKLVGLRAGEKLHEDMLAKTELDFTFEVPDQNLLQIRPQYTQKDYQNWQKYKGPEFNSALWVKDNIVELAELIKKGIKES
jgi:FlaA1/EpsC-like NDP-sugar epimerase